MAFEFTTNQTDMIDNAYYMWLTTVRDDGMPQPTPIWFVREDDTFLIYSRPEAQKLRNIGQNAKVALSFNSDGEAENYIVIMGEAAIDNQVLPSHLHKSYAAKYAEGVKGLNWTPEYMSSQFSVAIRVTPTKVRLGE